MSTRQSKNAAFLRVMRESGGPAQSASTPAIATTSGQEVPSSPQPSSASQQIGSPSSALPTLALEPMADAHGEDSVGKPSQTPPANSGVDHRAPPETIPPPYAARSSIRRRGQGGVNVQRNRVGLKAAVAHINPVAHRQLKQIAVEQDMTIEDLLKSGINMVFDYYKRPRMA